MKRNKFSIHNIFFIIVALLVHLDVILITYGVIFISHSYFSYTDGGNKGQLAELRNVLHKRPDAKY